MIVWPLWLCARLMPDLSPLAQTRSGQIAIALGFILLALLVSYESKRKYREVVQIGQSRFWRWIDKVFLLSRAAQQHVSNLFVFVPVVAVTAVIVVYVPEPYRDILTTIVLEIFLWRLYVSLKARHFPNEN